MRGDNVVADPFLHPKGILQVNKMYYTIQGEGPDAGRPALFLRLKGCNLRCHFCDTDFSTGSEVTVAEIVAGIRDVRMEHTFDLVVITGGEPLLQNIIPLVKVLNDGGFSVSVETAGTVYVPNLELFFKADRSIHGNLIVCSPKTPKINEQIESLVGAWKYIIRDGETGPHTGLPVMSTQIPGFFSALHHPKETTPNSMIYLQPMDEGDVNLTANNAVRAAQLCMSHGYRLSIQVHKVLGLE